MLVSDDQLRDLYTRRSEPMVRLAAWLLGDRAAAEDAVQDAFVRLATIDLAELGDPSAYLRTTVVNVCRSRLDRLARSRRLPLRTSEPEPGPEHRLVDEELAEALACLPRRQRECVILRYTEDLAVDQIARTLGISSGSVKRHLHRGLAKLATVLDHPRKAKP